MAAGAEFYASLQGLYMWGGVDVGGWGSLKMEMGAVGCRYVGELLMLHCSADGFWCFQAALGGNGKQAGLRSRIRQRQPENLVMR